MVFGEYDNGLRRDKSLKGIISMLRRGYSPHGTPLGYVNKNKFTTADKHVYAFSDEAKLIS